MASTYQLDAALVPVQDRAPRRTSRLRISGAAIVWTLLGLLIAWLVVVPIVLLVFSSFKPEGFPTDVGFTLAHYREAYSDPELWSVIGNSLIFMVGSTAVCVAAGIGLAWLVERTDVPAAGWFRVLIIIPMATPPMLLASAWAMLLSPRTGSLNHALMAVLGLEVAPFNIYTMGGMIFVEGLTLVPTVFLMLSFAFRQADPSHEEAALMSGASAWRVFWCVTLPMMRPAILGAVAFMAIVCLVVFDVPGTLGMPGRVFVLSTQIYYLFGTSPSGVPQFGQISALGVMILACLVLLALAYQSFTRQSSQFVTVSGKGFRPRQRSLGRARWLGAALVWLYLVLAIVLPLGMLLWASFMPYMAPISWKMAQLATLENHAAFLSNPEIITAVVNSVVVSLLAASVVVIMSGIAGWIIVRQRGLAGRILDVLTFIPLAIPGVIMGVALTYVYLSISVVSIYGTIWILVIAYTTLYLAYGSRATQSAFFQLHKELEEAGKTSGASAWRTHLRITFPLVLPALFGVWVWVVAHVMRELSIALMLHRKDNTMISTLIWGYWSGGNPMAASAVGVWLIAALTAMIAISHMIGRRRPSL